MPIQNEAKMDVAYTVSHTVVTVNTEKLRKFVRRETRKRMSEKETEFFVVSVLLYSIGMSSSSFFWISSKITCKQKKRVVNKR